MAQRPRAAHPAAPPVVQATAAAAEKAQARGDAEAGRSGRPSGAAGRRGSWRAGRRGRARAGDAPIAVGTVASVDADRLTLTNFAGKTVTVTVPPNATVTTTSGLAGLKPGAPVSVTGAANPDGSVTATSITSRTTGG